MACGRRCAVAGPTVQRTGSRSFPIASVSSLSRAVVVVRHAKRCCDTGIPRNSLDTGIPSEPTVEILSQETGWNRLFSQFGDGFTDIVEPTTQLWAQDSFLVPAQGIAVVAGEHLRHPRQQLGRALEFSPKPAQLLIELLRKSQELSLPRTMVRGRNIA